LIRKVVELGLNPIEEENSIEYEIENGSVPRLLDNDGNRSMPLERNKTKDNVLF
jgi:hypothetical protein